MGFEPVNESDLPRFQGKGDRQRPTDKTEFDQNYDRIFGSLYRICEVCGARINTNKFTTCPFH